MVIYLQNKHVAILEKELLATLNYMPGLTAEKDAALRAALSAIEQQKNGAPFRLWQRDENARTSPAPMSAPEEHY